ncbi:MAG: aspartate--tRNA ligase, partial [Ureaplasma sp.]|nr:aspartate--tRNA ligase [Ureaplasma sp.]
MKRTYCGKINKEIDLNNKVKVSGWIKNIRKLGFLNFIELRDLTGMIQVVIPETFKDKELIEKLTRESVVTIVGKIVNRKSVNNNIKNGDIELEIEEIEVHSISETPPLIIEKETDALDETRFENRYLDLRRPNIQEIFIFKSKLLKIINEFLDKENFLYVETPILAKPTPEGARDYLVPSRVKNGNFYALPQSPQIYKQLLMVSGFDRYYQIAKCFRDEDLRSDRQPEFTQLDMEMSFVNEEDIFEIIENMIKYIMQKSMNIDIQIPFKRLSFDDSMLMYGNDKPDTRFENIIKDSLEIVKKSNNEFIITLLENNNVTCRTLAFENEISRKELDELDSKLKGADYRNSSYVKISNNEVTGSFSKKIEKELILEIAKQHNIQDGIIFFNFDTAKKASVQLGFIRNYLAKKLNLIDKNKFNFLWIIDWPLFEYDEEMKTYSPAHHPFTQPQIEFHKDFDINQENAKARAYDLVLNGTELGGGSIRIIDKTMQERMFKAIGLSKNEYENKFS